MTVILLELSQCEFERLDGGPGFCFGVFTVDEPDHAHGNTRQYCNDDGHSQNFD